MKDKELIEEIKKHNYSIELKDYLTELVNLSISPFHDLDILNKVELDKLEYEIIRYNLVSKSIRALQGLNIISNNTSDNFKLKAKLNHKHNLLNILFLSYISIDIYDRTNIVQIYNSINLKRTDLRNKLNGCGYYGYNSNDLKILNQIKSIEQYLEELELIMNDKELIGYDRRLLEELQIPKEKGIPVGIDTIYETDELYSNKKILVYKNSLYKPERMF